MLTIYDLGSSGSLVHSFHRNKTRRCKVGIAKEERRVVSFVVKTYSFVLGDEQVARAFPERTTNNTPGRFSDIYGEITSFHNNFIHRTKHCFFVSV